ncbi:T9SS type A sorting domain-containing protein [Owenweeksia hongkongensis]|uniref:T9SS type A sorting domain-containing protein n=1 Tax=Owenweeksia hongkongensis TaxID=253245 RepID=UPI003A93DAFB
MKKGLFWICAMAALPAFAQQSSKLEVTHSQVKGYAAQEGDYIPIKKGTSVVSTSLGKASNAYSTAFGSKTYLWVDPSINTITFTHRNDVGLFPSETSGHLRYDVSKDGGTTWNVDQGPIWSPTGAQGALNGPARYPQGVIVNPTGNTQPDSAYLAFFAPTLNGTNSAGSWGGQVFGSIQLDGSNLDVSELTTDPANGIFFQVSDDFTFVADSQIVVGLNQGDDVTSGTVMYNDTLILTKGKWNASTKSLDQSFVKAYFPFETDTAGTAGNTIFGDCKVAFSPDGSVGYISGIGYLDDANVAPYGVYSPAVIKTTDGGKTWSAQTGVNLDNLVITNHGNTLLDSLSDLYPAWAIGALTTAFEHDLVVDKNGNPHIVCNVVPSANNTLTSTGTSGTAFSVYSALNMIVDVYSTDGGTSWEAHLIDTASTFRGEYGPAAEVAEDNRPQVARTPDGSVLIYAYGDTDFLTFGIADNLFPDIKMRSLDVDNDQLGPLSVMTNNQSDKGTANMFNLPHIVYAPNANGEIHVPATATEFTNDDRTLVTSSVQYIYYDLMYNMNSGIGITEFDVEKGEVSSIYPNPASNNAWMEYSVKVPGEYTIQISSITGVVVKSIELGNVGSGNYKQQLMTENLTNGVYVVTLRSGDYASSQRMVIQK